MSDGLDYAKTLLSKELGKYSAVSDNDDGDSQTSTLDVEPPLHWHRRSRLWAVLPWTLVVVLASMNAALLAILWSRSGDPGPIGTESRQWGTFGTGYRTEFGRFMIDHPGVLQG